MATRYQGITQFYLLAQAFCLNERYLHLPFPAGAGPYLPTPKGWKAELAWAARTVAQSAQDCYASVIAPTTQIGLGQ